jgi:hypothetical protein
MPRFYFDLMDDQTVYDHKGVILPGQQEAMKFATTFAIELMEAKPELFGESWAAWAVRVCNGQFQPILTLPFKDVVAGSVREEC